ncbi:hypothetical protein BT69DRAFT_1352108 [Atractiella rhizophila]|nr:hypothetical protein BT69DRAFT_1352108 [Atractiella rhizophila]
MKFWENDGPSLARRISLKVTHPTPSSTLYTVTQLRSTPLAWVGLTVALLFIWVRSFWVAGIIGAYSIYYAFTGRKRTSTLLLLPSLGVQLSTKPILIPISHIRAAHLNEVVHGWKVIWVLVLVLQRPEGEEGETELVVVFEDIKPPLKVLVTVWKDLKLAIEDGASRNNQNTG